MKNTESSNQTYIIIAIIAQIFTRNKLNKITTEYFGDNSVVLIFHNIKIIKLSGFAEHHFAYHVLVYIDLTMISPIKTK